MLLEELTFFHRLIFLGVTILIGCLVQYIVSPILLNGKWDKMSTARRRSQILSGGLGAFTFGLFVFSAPREWNIFFAMLLTMLGGFGGVASLQWLYGKFLKS
jgi:hypothetical protein